MEQKFKEAVEFVLAEWDSNTHLQGVLSRHACVGLSDAQLQEWERSESWPENTPLLRRGLLLILQPSWVRGEIGLWFDKLHKDTTGKEIAYLRGSPDFINRTITELLWREFAAAEEKKIKGEYEEWLTRQTT